MEPDDDAPRVILKGRGSPACWWLELQQGAGTAEEEAARRRAQSTLIRGMGMAVTDAQLPLLAACWQPPASLDWSLQCLRRVTVRGLRKRGCEMGCG
ncbi:MAG: hypothetical protein WDW36_008647 [Sanguina aurantia]